LKSSLQKRQSFFHGRFLPPDVVAILFLFLPSAVDGYSKRNSIAAAGRSAFGRPPQTPRKEKRRR
jgi:hypothetical protein